MVCSMFGVENICMYTTQKEKLVKEECSCEYAHGCEKSLNFK